MSTQRTLVRDRIRSLRDWLNYLSDEAGSIGKALLSSLSPMLFPIPLTQALHVFSARKIIWSEVQRTVGK